MRLSQLDLIGGREICTTLDRCIYLTDTLSCGVFSIYFSLLAITFLAQFAREWHKSLVDGCF